MDKLPVSSVHPASAKRQLANHLQVPIPQILFCTYPVVEDILRLRFNPGPTPCDLVYCNVAEAFTKEMISHSGILRCAGHADHDACQIMSTRPGYEKVYTMFKAAQSQILS
ncbi:hypothetical protein K435DRAFT_772918 [Dendrothele bispora CBS 962.96]|uniref:Uncharacterized protein n=1 Tax=Dendrothele bispora (strain CBS 962.96) TaxID=1314807 RepID=A0A4S8MUX9_DENBC|nr:hypothetical protein K435DRAFT_772918 [Dendrothele bispora CBS 962.96]